MSSAEKSDNIPDLDDRRYGIAEVAELVGVTVHVLRQWEARFPQLRPGRDRANRRFYRAKDIEIARRIKQLVRDDKMTSEGASKRLTQELQGEGAPRTNTEILDLLDTIETEVRGMLDTLDRGDEDGE